MELHVDFPVTEKNMLTSL